MHCMSTVGSTYNYGMAESHQLYQGKLQGTAILQNSRRMSWKGFPWRGHCSKTLPCQLQLPLPLFQDINGYLSRLPLLITRCFRHAFLKKSEEERPCTTRLLQLVPYHLFLFPLAPQLPMSLLSQILEIWALATCSCRRLLLEYRLQNPSPEVRSMLCLSLILQVTTPADNAHFFFCTGDVCVLCWWATCYLDKEASENKLAACSRQHCWGKDRHLTFGILPSEARTVECHSKLIWVSATFTHLYFQIRFWGAKTRFLLSASS